MFDNIQDLSTLASSKARISFDGGMFDGGMKASEHNDGAENT